MKPLSLALAGIVTVLAMAGCEDNPSNLSSKDKLGGNMAARPADLGDKMKEAKENYDKTHPTSNFGPNAKDVGSGPSTPGAPSGG